LSTDRLIELLRDQHVGCVPIVNEAGRAIGIVTKLDVVECMKEDRPTARDLMMPIAMSLDAHATVGQAARVMSAERIHHVLVVDDDRRLIGVVSALDVVHWLARNDGLAGE
jgi:IMP dehydrogenase